MVVKSVIYVSFQGFEGKHLFLKIEHDFNLLRTLRWKMGLSVKEFFPGFEQQQFALQEKNFDEKSFSFGKVFFFCYHLWSLSDSFVLLQNCLVRCAKPPIIVQRAIIGKINLENLFFYSIFGLWAEKTWTFSKTVRHDSQNIAYICRWSLSEVFMEAKFFVWRFSVIEWKHRIPSEKVFSGLSKAHFKYPVQHFEKEVMNEKFTFCGLFRALCVFLLRQES